MQLLGNPNLPLGLPLPVLLSGFHLQLIWYLFFQFLVIGTCNGLTHTWIEFEGNTQDRMLTLFFPILSDETEPFWINMLASSPLIVSSLDMCAYKSHYFIEKCVNVMQRYAWDVRVTCVHTCTKLNASRMYRLPFHNKNVKFKAPIMLNILTPMHNEIQEFYNLHLSDPYS